MVKIAEGIEYVSIYFVLGEAPQGWTRNAIKDPPSNGWSNAFIIRRDGFLPKIFVPYTLQSWPVPLDCYELERPRDPIKDLNKDWMLDCLTRNLRTYSKISGHQVDPDAAIDIIKAMGFEVPEEFRPAEEVKPVKEKKVKAKSAVREAREGLISVASIAEGLKIIPRVARGYLRAAKVDKPAHGWAGDQAWADEIKAILEAEMAKEKKPKPAKKAVEKKPEPKKKVKIEVKDTPAQKKMLKAIPKPAKKKAPAKKPATKKATKKKGVRK